MTSQPLDSFKRHISLQELREFAYFRSIRWVASIDSTNKTLANEVRQKSVPLPAILVADRQSSGIGRNGNNWWSPPGCLMFSMAIPIAFSPASSSSGESDWESEHETTIDLLPLRVGFSVATALNSISGVKPMIKWPNDVYFDRSKVCGILIEVLSVQENELTNLVAVIGVGINCQVEVASSPLGLQSIATSLHRWTNEAHFEKTSTENVLLTFLQQWLLYEQRERAKPGWLVEEWADWSLLDGKWVEIDRTFDTVQGKCIGLHSSGGLLIQNERLEIVTVAAGSVLSFRDLGAG